LRLSNDALCTQKADAEQSGYRLEADRVYAPEQEENGKPAVRMVVSKVYFSRREHHQMNFKPICI